GGRKSLRIASHRAYIFIASHRPETRAVRFFVPEDRIVLAQPSKLIVWLAMRERRCGQQVDFWFSHRGFYLSALDRTIGRSSEGGNATVRARRVLQKGLAPEVSPLEPPNKCSMRFAETGGSTASGRSPLFRSLEYQVGLYNRSLKSRKQRQIAS